MPQPGPLPEPLTAFMAKSAVALSIADPLQPDCPLVAVNTKFERITGYDADEVIGRNCRFLQPPEGAGPVRDRMRAFLHSDSRADEQFLIANRRKSGDPFLNLVYMSKLVKKDRVTLILASQFDISHGTRVSAVAYARALENDVRLLRDVLAPSRWELMTTYPILANTSALIARARHDEFDE